MSRIGIFRSFDDRLNLVIPIAFLLAILGGVAAPVKWFGSDAGLAHLMEELVVDVLLLNVTHNAFTVMMLVSFPELRIWLTRQSGGTTGFFLKATLIFFGLSGLFAFGIAGHVPYFWEAMLPLSRFFPIQHALAQSLGLSLLYNGKGATPAERPAKWLELCERYSVWALIVLMVTAVWAATKFQLLGVSFEVLSLRHIFYMSLAVSLLLVATTILYPKTIRLNKMLFALRFPVWAFSVTSPLAIWATRAIHGLEYLFVVRKMSSNSKFSSWKAVAFYVLGATFLFAIARVYYFSYARAEMGGADASNTALMILASVSTAFSFLHYYLDRQLFLMRRPTNRELVAPLLKN